LVGKLMGHFSAALGKRFGKSGKAFTLLELKAKIVPNRYKVRGDGDEGNWALTSRHGTDFCARMAHSGAVDCC
jgi:hypothetical protein